MNSKQGGNDMEILRTWIIGVTAAAMILAAAQALMPEGPVKRVGRLTAGLVLALALMQPLFLLNHQDLSELARGLPAGTETAEEFPMKPIIEQELAAYIVDKGEELGADLTAAVTCVSDEHGVPIPKEAVVTGTLTPDQREVLSAVLEQDLGIPIRDQTFREG